jgi:nucleoid-associated protein YgaU
MMMTISTKTMMKRRMMMTNEHGAKALRSLRPLAALLLAMVLAGCDNGMSISEIEAKERASRLYTTAMEDLQAGRTDPAIRGFEQVLVQEPRNYLAHFQLATLLQDIKKDYIGAISHYKSYLLFRPTSDKATIASDRMRVCDTLLSAEYLRKAGGKATEKLSDENAKIAEEAKKLREQVKKLEGQLAQAQAQVDRLSEENGRYRRQIGGLGADAEAGGSRKHLTKSALAELKDMEGERQRRRLRPTDAELLDDDAPPEDRARIAAELKREKEALARDEAEEGKAKPAPKATGDVASTSSTLAAKGKEGQGGGAFDSFWNKDGQQKKTAGRPETYVVQQGDTLSKISRRFYGTPSKWRAIREANKAIIPFDGRLSAGQEIRLP